MFDFALNAAVTFYVNSLRAEAVQRKLPVLSHTNLLASEIKQDHPLNLSISISGGEEIN